MSGATLATSLAEAARRVEQGDPDRFAATMATPAALRDRLWPLYAANIEIARAPWVSSEPMIGEMRLQWWVDGLEALAATGRAPDHEIGASLLPLRACAAGLARIAEARRRDCWREGFSTAEALNDYLRATSGELFSLAGEALGSVETEALRDYGTAAGMAAWLRAAPELSLRGWQPLPESGEGAGALAGAALAGLTAAEKRLRHADRAARMAILPAWQARSVLRRALRTRGAGPLDGSEFARRFGLVRACFRL